MVQVDPGRSTKVRPVLNIIGLSPAVSFPRAKDGLCHLEGSIPFNTNDEGYYSQPTCSLSRFHSKDRLHVSFELELGRFHSRPLWPVHGPPRDLFVWRVSVRHLDVKEHFG